MTVFKKSALESFSELKSFTSLQKSACTNCDSSKITLVSVKSLNES